MSKSQIVEKTQGDIAWSHLNGTTKRQVNVIGQYPRARQQMLLLSAHALHHRPDLLQDIFANFPPPLLVHQHDVQVVPINPVARAARPALDALDEE